MSRAHSIARPRQTGIACVGVALAAVVLAAQTPQQPVFRTGVSLVRVDVAVTDRHGEPATSLTADDFDLEEDGIPQTVQTFKFVSADGRPAEGDDTSLAIRSPEHAAAEAARDEVRVFLIFWDEYHIGNTYRARAALTELVSTAFGPTDLVALMHPLLPSDAITFTRDHSDLINTIHTLKGRRGRRRDATAYCREQSPPWPTPAGPRSKRRSRPDVWRGR